jgi:hypothetical protein
MSKLVRFIVAAAAAAVVGTAVSNLTSKKSEEEEKNTSDEEDDQVSFINIEDGSAAKAEEETQVREIAKLYPYLSEAFIKEQFEKNDDYNRDYPADTLVRLVQKASFENDTDKQAFVDIARTRGYETEDAADHTVAVSRRLFTENGAILSDIYNVANQVVCLRGKWLGCDIEK